MGDIERTRRFMECPGHGPVKVEVGGAYGDKVVCARCKAEAVEIEYVRADAYRGAVVIDDAAIERAADALAAKLHWLRDFDRARELARAALHAARGR